MKTIFIKIGHNIKRFIMSENKDEKIEDVLVDSELAKKLVISFLIIGSKLN